ncbi:hypothetical protein CH063_08578, partial [Colletotrichum higginsianum]
GARMCVSCSLSSLVSLWPLASADVLSVLTTPSPTERMTEWGHVRGVLHTNRRTSLMAYFT